MHKLSRLVRRDLALVPFAGTGCRMSGCDASPVVA